MNSKYDYWARDLARRCKEKESVGTLFHFFLEQIEQAGLAGDPCGGEKATELCREANRLGITDKVTRFVLDGMSPEDAFEAWAMIA
jgi:hypothetical protein